jgi:hypothetical protein
MKLRRSLYSLYPSDPRTAMRRGAAWPPAERPSSCVAVQPAVSRWQVPHRRAVMVAERRVCRPQQHGSPSQRCRGTRISGCPPCLGRPVRVHMSSVRPSVSGVRYVSSVRAPGVRTSGVQCPVSVSSASVRHPCPLVRTGEFVERLGAAGSHTFRDRPVGNYLIRGTLSTD